MAKSLYVDVLPAPMFAPKADSKVVLLYKTLVTLTFPLDLAFVMLTL